MLFGVASSSGEGIYGKAGFSVSNGLDFFGALLGEMAWLRTRLEGEARERSLAFVDLTEGNEVRRTMLNRRCEPISAADDDRNF